jgi:membrane protease YdiL (CAAX protease family)
MMQNILLGVTMNSKFILLLLIAGLNIPVFLELYKHALKNKPSWLKAVIAIVYWGAAVATQTMAAFAGILYLYFAYYKNMREEEDSGVVNVWHIKPFDVPIAILMTAAVRIALFFIQIIYAIILVKLVKYNIKPQDVVTYYSEAALLYKLILAVDIVIIAPFVEEFVFRYFLYGKVFAPRMPLFIAGIFSAALFTISHLNVGGVPTFFILGLLCTYLFQKKGYFAAVIAHAVSNLISLLSI